MVFVTMPKHYKVRVNCIYLFAIYFEYLLQYVFINTCRERCRLYEQRRFGQEYSEQA